MSETRMRCLELAASYYGGGYSSGALVKKASEFHDFVTGSRDAELARAADEFVAKATDLKTVSELQGRPAPTRTVSELQGEALPRQTLSDQ